MVGHDAMDLDAVVSEEAPSVQEEADAGAAFLIGQISEQARREWSSITTCRVLPVHPAGVALAGSIASDRVTDPSEFAELLDVDVDELARMGALMSQAPARRAREPKAG